MPISNICFEPTKLIIISSRYSAELAALSLIDNKMSYMYVDLGMRRYCTVMTEN